MIVEMTTAPTPPPIYSEYDESHPARAKHTFNTHRIIQEDG